MQVKGMNVEMSDHFRDRLKERSINLKDIFYCLHDLFNEIKLYNDTGLELCHRLHQCSFFFQVRHDKIVLITALDKYAKHVNNAVII